MKHIFIVNPAAGKVDDTERIRAELAGYRDRYDCDIYVTKAPGDATDFIRTYCAEHPGEEVRFYACGGDGTLNEVVNGAVGHPSVSVSCYPSGSGDDFVKYYGGREGFLDIGSLLEAPDEEIDLLSVNGLYSLNVTNFGFDTKVCKTMIRVKRKKIIGGKRAYITGVVTALITAMKNACKVYADGELLNPKGKILLCTLSNGSYVGGGFCCAPRSDNRDGLMEVALFRPLSRFTFVKLLPVYTKGEHLDDKRFQKYLTYRQAKKVHIDAPEGFAVTVDGEIVDGTSFDIEIVPRAIRFAAPRGCVLIAGRKGQTFGEA